MFDTSLGLVAVAVLAGAIAGVSGFGIGSLLTPALMFSMPAAEAVAILALPHAWVTTVRWLKLRREIHWPTFRQFGLASALGGLAGAALQSQLGSPALTIILAVLLLIAGITEVLQRPIPLPRTPVWRLIGGLLSGGFGGLVGNQGGIRAAALLGFRLTPRQIVATATASALLVDAARVPVYLATHRAAIAARIGLAVTIAIGATAGTFVGVPLLRRIPPPTYRRLVGALLIGLGVVLLTQLAVSRKP
ncbi:MAG TPA: sulfite exporter TauE/SafE family protein [Vicinamibacterales bacterium]|nr:sulfite exporter TauE/SafE family protein [Vicinamibacterales bacterium]